MSAFVRSCEECGKPQSYEPSTFVWRHSEHGYVSCMAADLNAARASWPICRYCVDPVRPGSAAACSGLDMQGPHDVHSPKETAAIREAEDHEWHDDRAMNPECSLCNPARRTARR